MCSENTEQENVTRQGTNRKGQCQSPNELQIGPNTSGGIKELLSERPNNAGPSCLLTWHDHASKLNCGGFFLFFFFFCCFPCREAGQCFVWGRLCSGGANEPSSHRPSWLSCHVREHLHRTQSSRDVNEFSCTGACTPSGEMNVSVVAMPVGNQGKGISEVMTVFQPSHRRYSGDSWAKTNHDRCQGEASLIKDKDAKTRVYYYKMCQQVFLALMEEHDTADLMKCFNG